MKSGFTNTWVEAQGHRKPYPGAPIPPPGFYNLNPAGNNEQGIAQTSVTEGQPKRIVPTPVSVATSQSPAEVMKSPEQLKQETADLTQRLENEKKQQEK